MSLEEQIKTYKELGRAIDELEKQRKGLGVAIREQMSQNALRIEGYVVRRYSRLSIKVSLEEARLLDAVKIEEVVDKDKIKSLHQLGKVIQGVSEIQYIQVSEVTDVPSEVKAIERISGL